MSNSRHFGVCIKAYIHNYTHLIFTTLWDKFYYFIHLADKERETGKQKSHGQGHTVSVGAKICTWVVLNSFIISPSSN